MPLNRCERGCPVECRVGKRPRHVEGVVAVYRDQRVVIRREVVRYVGVVHENIRVEEIGNVGVADIRQVIGRVHLRKYRLVE